MTYARERRVYKLQGKPPICDSADSVSFVPDELEIDVADDTTISVWVRSKEGSNGRVKSAVFGNLGFFPKLNTAPDWIQEELDEIAPQWRDLTE